MKYLILTYRSVPGTVASGNVAALRALQEELAATGQLISAEGLALPQHGRVVQLRDDARLVTAGTYGDAGHRIAGFLLIDCAGDERADEIAGRVSAAIGDRVEVRGVVLSS